MVFTNGVLGLLGLVVQGVAAASWCYLAAEGTAHILSKAQDKPPAILNLLCWAIAAGTSYCIYRQFKWVREDQEFTRWLVSNSEKIRNRNAVFYKGQRVSLETRLVRHHLVFSALIVSFRKQTRWIIKDKEPRTWHALGASLYTCFYGWWGFPFGIFWTIVALVKNIQGATSVTVQQLLQPAPANPVGFAGRFQKDFARRVRTGFFIDEIPAGILPVETGR